MPSCYIKIFFLLSMSLLVMSCSSKMLYSYKNVTYESPEPVIQAIKTDNEIIINKIMPTNNPTGGSVIVFIPSKYYIKKNIIFEWTNGEPSQEMEEKAKDFHATKFYVELRGIVDAIDKRKIFDRVNISDYADPANVAYIEEIALFFIKKENKWQSLLKRKNDASTELFVIEEVSSALPPVQRLILWLDNIEKISRKKGL